ncbi:MAG: hypothetical protein ACJ8EF_06025 [Bradyrhizobium sp.]|jgi:ATP-dependent DNA ligase
MPTTRAKTNFFILMPPVQTHPAIKRAKSPPGNRKPGVVLLDSISERTYLIGMLRKLEYLPCIQVKHDGYRLIVQRDGKRVRLLTRRGTI